MRLVAISAILVASLISLTSADVARAAANSPQLTSEEEVLVKRSLDRGTLMYAYDQAAWHGTDDMVAKMPTGVERIGGWIVDGPANNPHLIMFDRDDESPRAVYEADFRDGVLVSSRVLNSGETAQLSPGRRALIAALRTARKAFEANHTGRCKPNDFNTIVLPGEGGKILVYFLTPQTVNDAVPLAGHYLVEVSPDGTAGSVQSFTNVSCMEMPITNEKGVRPTAIVTTDLLHLTPTEVQVFSSLSAHIPIYVGTVKNDSLWSVDGNQIRLLNDHAK